MRAHDARVSSSTFARGVKERRLEADVLQIGQILVDRDLHAEAGVRVDVRQNKQVGRANEEAAVERVDAETAGAAEPHHRLETDLSGQVTAEHPLQRLGALRLRCSKQRQMMNATAREFRHTSCNEREVKQQSNLRTFTDFC